LASPEGSGSARTFYEIKNGHSPPISPNASDSIPGIRSLMQIPFKNNTSTSRDHSTCYSVQAIPLDACESKNLVLGVITSEVKKALFSEKISFKSLPLLSTTIPWVQFSLFKKTAWKRVKFSRKKIQARFPGKSRQPDSFFSF
jgi:hypothetical protein